MVGESMKIPALVAEFIGTFALIFVGVLVIHHLVPAGAAGLVGIAIAHGITIACFVSATGAISGGHLNPAVSFGLFLGKKIDLMTMITYWVAQLLGATVAAFAVKAVLTGDAMDVIKGGTPALGQTTTLLPGIIAEAITTFFLVFVVYGSAVDRRAPKVGGLFIGLTVTLGIFAVGPLTGGALNPARWLGPALVAGNLDNALVYIVGPLLGGGLAGLVYSMILEEKTPAEGSA